MSIDADEIDPLDECGLPIEKLKLSEATVEKLVLQGFYTIGHMTRYLKWGRRLTDIKGIGSERAAKIADALWEFRKTYNPPSE